MTMREVSEDNVSERETCRIVRASVRAFDCAYTRYTSEPFALGQMLAVREGPHVTFGIVTDSESGPDDPSRPLTPRGQPGQTANDVLTSNPEIEYLLRTTLSAAICGHIEREVAHPLHPPTPPPLLAEVHAASESENVRIAAEGRFLVPLLANPAVDDAVVTAAIRGVAHAAGAGERDFLIAAGKELARLLKAEPARLTSILRAVEPES